MLEKIFSKKKILITGHTGFKGSWLALWLKNLNSQVLGVSLDIPTKPSHYSTIELKNNIRNEFIDIKDLIKLKKIFRQFKPDFVFHLAAQSLVKKSYSNPELTFNTNSIGTLNVMECLKETKKGCVAVIITSDKSYKNKEIKRGYKENDILGGVDPYSASKASAELIINSYFESFLKYKKNLSIGIARAGNVIGGGDWSENRLIPDCIKSWSINSSVKIRNPNSTRPWQHVLDAVYGYLLLAIKLKKNKKLNGQAFNFGPSTKNNFKVIDVLVLMKKFWKSINWTINEKKNNHYESSLLKLNSNKSKKLLNWKANLNFEESIKYTTEWYKIFYKNRKKIRDLSSYQILQYMRKIKKK
jgi:CDP-glucose 4,6-dehydratase